MANIFISTLSFVFFLNLLNFKMQTLCQIVHTTAHVTYCSPFINKVLFFELASVNAETDFFFLHSFKLQDSLKLEYCIYVSNFYSLNIEAIIAFLPRGNVNRFSCHFGTAVPKCFG